VQAFNGAITAYTSDLLKTYNQYDMAIDLSDIFSTIKFTATVVPTDGTPLLAAVCCTR
jgi:hypothetical protein